MAKGIYFGSKVKPLDIYYALGKFGTVVEEDVREVEREVCEYGARSANGALAKGASSTGGITIEARRNSSGGYGTASVPDYQLVAKGPKVTNKWHALEGGRKTKPRGFKAYDVPLVKILEYGTGIWATSGPGYTGNKGNRGLVGWDYYDEEAGRWYHTNGRPGIHFMREATQKMRVYLPSCARRVFKASETKRKMGL